MPITTAESVAVRALARIDEPKMELTRLEERLPPLLSMIAGMVDLTGFFTLGNIFTAHITGNLVVAAAATVRGGPVKLAPVLAIPVFMLALAVVWSVSKASNRRGVALARLLLVIQFALLTTVLVFCVLTRPSMNPHGMTAGIAAMIAASAVACQFALFRLAIPGAISTAVMTGNLANTVLGLTDLLSKDPLMTADKDRLKRSLPLLIGFLMGCVFAAVAVSWSAEWAWLFPVVLSGAALALQ